MTLLHGWLLKQFLLRYTMFYFCKHNRWMGAKGLCVPIRKKYSSLG